MAWTWHERSAAVSAVPLPKRSGHTAFVTASGQPMLFGGYAEGEIPSDRFVVNDLWAWNNNEKNGGWYRVETTGAVPEPRLVAASAVSGGKAYLFGGWNPSSTTVPPPGIFTDVHELDLESFVWTKLSCTLPDGPTSRHVAVALTDGTIMLHTHRCDNYIIIFDPATASFRKQAMTGPCPSSRGLHAACRLDDTTVLLFGGAAKDQSMSDETFLLNVSDFSYVRLECNDGPSPRASPCLVTSSNKTAILFGGAAAAATGALSSLVPLNDLWVFAANTWSRIHTDVLPPPRNAATMVPIISTQGAEFVLTGGWRPFVETHNDCFVLQCL
jgi:Galactose oxidase, central domain/Kelch motif